MKTSPHFAVAIDGPAASGKSTLARILAQRLGLIMVNSGAMYRAVTWSILQKGIDPSDVDAVLAGFWEMELDGGDDGVSSTIAVDGRVLEQELRDDAVNANVSKIAAIPEIREKLVEMQRAYLQRANVVMEGRDIGTVVFPDTPFKIYVDADEEVRAARRRAAGEVDAVAARDQADSQRKTAPLMVAAGATILDTSHHTIESAVTAALEILREQGFEQK